MAETCKVKAFKEFYSKLVKVLPMDDISDLYSNDLLPGDNKAKIEALDTQRRKAEYFLDHVIKPGMEIGYTGQFDEMLKVMDNSEHPPVKFLIGKIKDFIKSEEKSLLEAPQDKPQDETSLLLNVSYGRFGVLPSTTQAPISKNI